jgi:hypothetical protein
MALSRRLHLKTGCQTGRTCISASVEDGLEIHLVVKLEKLNDAKKRLDIETKVTHLTIKCCILYSKLHAW